jgi:hypothetical protein
MVRWLQNGPDQPKIAEPPVPLLKREELTVWTDQHQLPSTAGNAETLKALLRGKVTAQLASLQPKDGASLKKYRDLMEPAWRVLMNPQPSPARGDVAGGGKVTVIVAPRLEDTEPYATALERKPGDGVVRVALSSHSPEAAAGGDNNQRKGFPATFYRTELARNVQDILDLLAAANRPGAASEIRLVALGDAALPALLARAISSHRVSRTILDLSTIDAAVESSNHPALLRLGGWKGAAALAPAGYLALHGKKFEGESLRASYKAAGREGAITISEEAWSRDRVLQELAR